MAPGWTVRTTGTADAWSLSTIPTTTSSKSTTTDAGLDLARARFTQGDFLGAFACCREILDRTPEDIAGLLLFARVCTVAGDLATARSVLAAALQNNPSCPTGSRLLELLATNPSYARAFAIDPDIEAHTNQYVFAAPVPLPHLVEAALRETPADADGALGNVLLRTGRIAEGLAAYERAVAAVPQDAKARMGLAERLRLFGRTDEARQHFARCLARTRTFYEPALEVEELRVGVLCAADFWEKSVAIDLLVDRNGTTLEKMYAGENAGAPVPTVYFNAIADPEDHAAIAWAQALERETRAPVVNDPALLARTSRTYLAQATALHPGLRIPQARRCAKAALSQTAAAFGFPYLVRPLHSHRGEGLARVGDTAALEAYLAECPPGEYVVSEFVDYKNEDGFYRKYRWIFIDGEPYPHHLAISPHWMVHYFSAPMGEHDWMRAQEAAFLTHPESVFDGRALEALRALGRTVGLEYFGADCALHGGDVLIFEANANMLAHDFFGTPEFAYKTPAFDRLRAAFNRMLRKKRA